MAASAEAIAAIQTVCKASKLDFIQDGDVIIIKKRPLETPLAKWTFGDVDGTYNVVFEDQELFSAILEVANAMNVQVFLPARRPEDDDEDAGGTSGGPIFDIPKVTLTMKKSTPEEILRELARLGNMDIEVIPLNEDDPSQGIGYKFDWKK